MMFLSKKRWIDCVVSNTMELAKQKKDIIIFTNSNFTTIDSQVNLIVRILSTIIPLKLFPIA